MEGFSRQEERFPKIGPQIFGVGNLLQIDGAFLLYRKLTRSILKGGCRRIATGTFLFFKGASDDYYLARKRP